MSTSAEIIAGSDARISVVIASNREAPFLNEAVASVRAQTYRADEIILVDDGSPSGALAAAAHQLGLRYVRQPHSGVSIAFNRGVSIARGDLIAVLGDDDVWHPDKLHLQVGALAAQPQATVCFCGGWFLNAEGNRIGREWRGETASRADMLSGRVNTPVISTMLIRRDAFLACGGFHPAFTHGEDDELILRLLQWGQFVGVDEPLFGYRRHGGNVSRSELAGRSASLQLLRLQIWGARARDDRGVEQLLHENLGRYARNAARATAHELLADIRRGHWRDAAAAGRWGLSERGIAFPADILAFLLGRARRR